MLPILNWIRTYDRQTFRSDLVAGLTLTALVVPQAIAYAFLAGLPAEFGLYTAILPVLIYTCLGTSRHLSVGSFALISMLLNSSAEQLSQSLFDCRSDDQRCHQQVIISIILSITLIAGVLELLMAMLRIGPFITKYLLPDCFVSGMTTAASIHIATSQVGTFLKLSIPKFHGTLGLFRIWEHILAGMFTRTHVPTMLVGAGTTLLIYLIRYLNQNFYRLFNRLREIVRGGNDLESTSYTKILQSPDEESQLISATVSTAPSPFPLSPAGTALPHDLSRSKRHENEKTLLLPDVLIALIVSTLVTMALNSSADLVSRVGKISVIDSIPSGLPGPRYPWASADYCKYISAGTTCPLVSQFLSQLLIPAIKITLVSVTLSLSSGRLFAKKLKYEHELDANQELYAFGFANIIGGLLSQAYMVSGSLSRTSIVVSVGGVTQIASLISGVMSLIILVSPPFTRILEQLPNTALSAVVIIAVVTLFWQIRDGILLIRQSFARNADDKTKAYLYRRAEACMWWITFLSVLLFDIDMGVAIGLSMSMLNLVWITFVPRLREMGMFLIRDMNAERSSVQVVSFQYLHRGIRRFSDAGLSQSSAEVGFFPLGTFELDSDFVARKGVFNSNEIPPSRLVLHRDVNDDSTRQMLIRDPIEFSSSKEGKRIAIVEFNSPRLFNNPAVLTRLLSTFYGKDDTVIVFIPVADHFSQKHFFEITSALPDIDIIFAVPDTFIIQKTATPVFHSVFDAYKHVAYSEPDLTV